MLKRCDFSYSRCATVSGAVVDAAPPVGIAAGLDLDHVGAEVGEVAGADRPGPAHRQVDDAQAFERPRRLARATRRRGARRRSSRRARRDPAPRPPKFGGVSVRWNGVPGASTVRPPTSIGTMALRSRNTGQLSTCFMSGTIANGRRRSRPEREPFLGGAVEEARDEARLQRIGAREPLAAHDVVRVAAELVHAHQLAERVPLRRRDDGDADEALLAAIDAHRIGRREAVEAPALLRRRRPRLDRLVLGERDGRLVHAHFPAPALLGEQRRHRRDEGGEPAHDRRLVVRQGERRAFRRSDQLHEARQCPAPSRRSP